MSSLHNPENRNNSHAAHPSLGKATDTQEESMSLSPYSQRHQIEAILEALAMNRASLTKTIAACNGLERGSYRVVITVDKEYNEVQIRLKDGPAARQAIATGYIDRGHDAESRAMAAEDLRSMVRAYLCR